MELDPQFLANIARQVAFSILFDKIPKSDKMAGLWYADEDEASALLKQSIFDGLKSIKIVETNSKEAKQKKKNNVNKKVNKATKKINLNWS